jgi:hypothetical protein
MSGRAVYIATAEGEEMLAERLAGPLRDAGYNVAHNGTITIGESQVGEATKILASGSPIIVCATVRAVGSTWTHKIVNAAHVYSDMRVFVVQMEKQAYVEQLALKAKVAQYCDNPAQALRDLLEALKNTFRFPGTLYRRVSAAHPSLVASSWIKLST